MNAPSTVWQGAGRRIHMQEVGLRDGLQMEKAFVPDSGGAGEYRGAPTACSGCHLEDDSHRGNLGARCEDCHDSGDWQRATRFDHAQTGFPLLGKHVGAACKGCHADAAHYRGTGKACGAAADCASAICTGSVCQAPSCADTVKNGNETDIDCGGADCADCANGKACAGNGDCVSGVCTGSVCQVPSCSDAIKNGTESDVDCGGSCAPCTGGKLCSGNGDCASNSCTAGHCDGQSCVDGLKNGAETDVDCGGSSCSKCANGKACIANSDCSSAGCVGGVCSVVAATCTDGLKNGLESDVDCGGGSCPKCPIGGACVSATSISTVAWYPSWRSPSVESGSVPLNAPA